MILNVVIIHCGKVSYISEMNSKEIVHNTAILSLTTLHSPSVPLKNQEYVTPLMKPPMK